MAWAGLTHSLLGPDERNVFIGHFRFPIKIKIKIIKKCKRCADFIKQSIIHQDF